MISVRIDDCFTTRGAQWVNGYSYPMHTLHDEVSDYLDHWFGKGEWHYVVKNDESGTEFHWIHIQNKCELFVEGSLKFNDLYGFCHGSRINEE